MNDCVRWSLKAVSLSSMLPADDASRQLWSVDSNEAGLAIPRPLKSIWSPAL
ncbi:hypothetical protein [Novipirellula sp.]|uniref:hypothetical protein n=1 Tax=Novipirellula sp. TaxID=2795430 RepID=UPI003565CBE9